MAVTAYWFTNTFLQAFDKAIDFEEASKIKVMLLDNSNAPCQDTCQFISNVDQDEMTGTNYDAGGEVLGTPAVSNSTNVAKFDGDNTTWSDSTITNARYAVLYYNTGTNTTSPVFSFVDFGQDESSSSGDFTIAWDANGIANISAENA